MGYQRNETNFISRQSAPRHRHLGALLDEGVLNLQTNQPSILYCPMDDFYRSWNQSQITRSDSQTNKKLYKQNHDVGTSYDTNELIAASYYGKINNSFGQWPGHKVDLLPSNFGIAFDHASLAKPERLPWLRRQRWHDPNRCMTRGRARFSVRSLLERGLWIAAF